ncbi:barrier-to-autointegration factor-like [Amphiprion ocellaris]|nr:barrier-to-autointegration factor-like [Amphiprion ocellaris]
MSPTKKQRNFVSELIGDKPVTALPGVRPDLGKKLQQKGYERADKLLGRFLVMRRDTEAFSDWLRRTSGAKPHLATSCINALQEYCDNNL